MYNSVLLNFISLHMKVPFSVFSELFCEDLTVITKKVSVALFLRRQVQLHACILSDTDTTLLLDYQQM